MRSRARFTLAASLALPLLVALSAPAAHGQFEVAGVEHILPTLPGHWAAAASFGSTEDLVMSYPAHSFVPFRSSNTYVTSNDPTVGLSMVDGGFMIKPVDLPSGALVIGIELDGCDFSTDDAIKVDLIQCASPAGNCAGVASLTTGDEVAFGCDFYAEPVEPALTLDHRNNRYVLQIDDSDSSLDTRFHAVRVFWRRQVSPAPAFPTFDDVPTGHPFFQHIEALAASGVTSGCDANNFCPNAPLNRGQMAVFLAKALGLHWENVAQP